MQFNNIVLAGFLGLAAAASSDSSSDVSSLVAKMPSCSIPCLEAAATSAGCDETDYACQCENQQAVSMNATSCLTTSCSISNITTTQSVVTEICDAVGGNSTSTSNSTVSSTGTSSSSSSSGTSSSKADSSAGSRSEVYGLAWAAIAGVVGLMVL